jgi:hypothetical protein
VSYTGTLMVGAHHRNPAIQAVKDFAQLSGITGVWHLLVLAGVLILRHLHGFVVILVAVAFTAGCVAGFLLDGHHFPAVMSALIGLLSIAVGITYHSLGEPKR